ncbi:ABC transporter ATP-binding protein [Comamonas composti]|uniref:ABC transporter ATP-binding protein n=1 Tax=Comamonas composti TaxID=408558 RepID=UPI000478F079|nr:ABC transporter ATP-binding protein [Comamonas composti]
MTSISSTSVPPRVGFIGLLRVAPWPLALAVVAAVVSAALSIAPFWFIYRITVQLFSMPPGAAMDMAAIWPLAWWALGLLALRWALMAVSHVLAHIGAFSIQHQLRLAMARHLGEVPLSFFAGRGSGSLRRTLSDDVSSLEGFYAHMLPDAVAAAAVPLAALALLFVADWRLALAALAPLPLAVAAQWWLMRRSAENMRDWSALQKRIADQVGEYVRGVHVVKSFGLDARSFGELATAVGGAVDWVLRYARGSVAGWALFVGLLTANLVVVAPLGAWLHMRGSLDVATWLLFLLVAPAVLAPLLRLTFALGEQVQRTEALARINEVLAAPPLAQSRMAQIPQAPPDIAFRGLRHRYGDRLALDGVDFTARAGQVTALVGPSGSGKSTLVRLVARLYEFESGSLRVGGVDVRDWPLDALLARVGIVFQEVVLFHGTVRDNLRLARPDASDVELQAAARAAQAHGFITALPQGYDTPLGERGARLSGGERQRLSIARALLKNAPILLLDEATASIDAENEALIQQALDTLCRGRTVIVVGHRLRTTRHADHIVVMQGGRVARQGTHDELLRACETYRRLWHDHEDARQWTLGEQGVRP